MFESFLFAFFTFSIFGWKREGGGPGGGGVLKLISHVWVKYVQNDVQYKSGHSSSHRASQKVSRRSFDSKLRRASFEAIGMRFYEILQ